MLRLIQLNVAYKDEITNYTIAQNISKASFRILFTSTEVTSQEGHQYARKCTE